MALVFSFGSFGDILSVIGVLNDIRKTLSDGHGSYSECADLLTDLNIFISSLQVLDRFQIRVGHDAVSTTMDGLAIASTTLQIQQSLVASEQIARNFKAILEQYNTRVLADSEGHLTRVKIALRKIRWALSSTRKDADSLRNKLTFHGVTVNRLLLAILVEAHLEDLRDQIPQSPVVEMLTLVDIQGLQTPIPMHLCSTRRAFHEYLEFSFRKRAGLAFIKRNAYTPTPKDSKDTDTLFAAKWDALARPNATLLMAAVLRIKQLKSNALSNKQRCPRCRTENDTNPVPGNMMICAYCQTSFDLRILEKSQMEKSFAESLTGSSRATSDVVADSPDAASQDSDEELADLEKELQYICRISVHVSVDDPVIHAPLFHANITRITAPAKCFIHTDRLPSFMTPEWLRDAAAEIRARYPDDKFEVFIRQFNPQAPGDPPAYRIKCTDCPTKLYIVGPGETINNFEIHLKNRSHRQKVNSRAHGIQS